MIEQAEAGGPDTQPTEDGLRHAAAGMQPNGISSEDLEDGELEEEPESAQAEPNGDSIENLHESEHKKSLTNASTMVGQQEKLGMPNAIINSGEISKFRFAISMWGNWTDFCLVKDETLKNLMMSWYYAGYYTGLYEGQQQVQSTPPK